MYHFKENFLFFFSWRTFLNNHSIFEKFQSGLRTNKTTGTALLKFVNDLKCIDMLLVLVLLDLRTAFDTVIYTILLDWYLVGLSGNILQWEKSSNKFGHMNLKDP